MRSFTTACIQPFFKLLQQARKFILYPALGLITWTSYAQQASNINFQPVPATPTSLTINWTNGTGVGRIVVIKNSTGTFKPTDNANITTLNANLNFTAGTNDQDASGGGVAAVVFAGTGAGPITVTNLTAGASYFVQVYEFTDATNSPDYILTTNATNPKGFVFYTASGSFIVPIDVTSVAVQAFGAGGGGGGVNGTGTTTTERGGGGGGGGGYSANSSVAVTSGASITVTIGSPGIAGDGAASTNGGAGGPTTFASSVPVTASGGAGGGTGTGTDDTGAGGTGGAGTTFNGGNGATAPGTNPDATSGGGGGGGAGTSSVGGNGSGSTAGTGGTGGGGSGAAGKVASDANASSATEIGGGGGGAYTIGSEGDENWNGGAGGPGYMIVSFNDNTVPTATFLRQPVTTNPYTNATSVTYRVTFNEAVSNVSTDGSDFAVATGGTAAITAIAVVANSAVQYDVTVSGISGEGDLNLNFGTTDIVDLSNNAVNTTPTSEEIYTRDVTSPTALQVGTVTAKGGNEVATYWNSTNTTLEVVVPLTGADASMTGGTIQVQIQNTTNTGYVSIANSGLYTITGTDVTNQTKTVVIAAADLIAATGGGSTGYLNGAVHNIRAIVTDITANPGATYTASATNLTVDTTPPAAPSAPVMQAASDTGSSSTDEITNDQTPTFDVTGMAGQKLELLEGTNVIATIVSATGASEPITPSSNLAEFATYSITVKVYDAAGNSTSSTALSPVNIDITPPSAPGTPNLTSGTDSGSSNSDNITNDNTPTFDDVTSNTNTNGATITINSSIDGDLAPTAVVATNDYTVNVTTVMSDGNHTITAKTSDVAGNVATSGSLAVTIDTQGPTVSSIVRASTNPTTAASVNYTVTFSESVQASTVTTADFGVTVTGSAAGADAAGTPTTGNSATYTIPVNTITGDGTIRLDKLNTAVTDVAGNAATNTYTAGEVYTVDNTNPTLTLTVPAASSTVNSANVTYTLSEDLASGSITWTRTGGTADGGSPHTANLTGTELNNGTKTNIVLTNAPTLVSGTVYTVALNGTDLATNAGTASSRTLVTFDNSAPNFTSTAPATSATVSNANVSYTPSETLVSGTITWTRVGGTADGNSPHVITLTGTELNTSAKTNVILTNNPTNLVNGAIYDVQFSGTDAGGNTGTVTNTSITYNDNVLPTTNTVGTVAAGPAGTTRQVTGYFNSTNTSLTVVVPLSTSDGTLDGGSVQVRVQNTATTGFINIPTSGLSTITAAERAAGTKTITVTLANLQSAVSGAQGYAVGAVAGLESAETRKLEFDVIVRDNSLNPITYTKSTSTLDVDLTAPAISTAINLYSNKGIQNINREVIIFRLNEDIYTNAGAQVADNNVFVNGVNITYGSAGFSVDDPGVGTDDVDANYVRYENDGGNNSADAGVPNTRLIWLESNANGSNWSATGPPITQVQYVQFGATSTDARIIRDAAGNEMTAFTSAVGAGTSTTIAAATNGVAAGPNLNNNTTQVVFGFSLTSTATVDLTALSIIATADPTNKLKNFKLYSNNGSDNFGTAVDLSQTATVVTSAPFAVNFNTISGVQLTAATTRYFYLVATLENYFYSTDPTIGFSLGVASLPDAGGGITVSSGGVTGTAQTGTTYTLKDLTAPSVSIITTSQPIIYQGNLTQTVAIQFNEPMKNSTAATAGTIDISFTGSDYWSAFTPVGWSTTTLTNDTYTVTFTHNGTDQNSLENAFITNATGLTDWGNIQPGAAASSNFTVDTQRPTVNSANITGSTIITQGSNTVTLEVIFSEKMNTSGGANDPTITIVPANANLSAGAFVWDTSSPTNDKLTVIYTHNLTQEALNGVYFTINGAKDANGNTQTAASNSSTFDIDTQRPYVVSMTRNTPTSQYINASTTFVWYNVTFNEPVNSTNLSVADFDVVTVSGSASAVVAAIANNGVTANQNVLLQTLTGEGEFKIDLVTGGGIVDQNGNALNTGFTTAETFIRDATKPTATTIDISSPTVSFTNVNGTSASSISWLVTFDEPISGVDATDFQLYRQNAPPSVPFLATPDATISFSTPLVVSGSGNTRTVTLNNVQLLSTTSDAHLFINLLNDGTILDNAGNPLNSNLNSTVVYPGSSSAGFNDYYTILFPEPSNPPINLQLVTSNPFDFTISWDQPVAPAVPAQYYFLDIKPSLSPSYFPVLGDGQYFSGSQYAFNSGGTLTYPFGSYFDGSAYQTLSSGLSYDVRVNSTTYSGYYNGFDLLDYLTSSTLNGTFTTSTASSTTLSLTTLATNIPSITDETPAGQFVNMLSFTIDDDGPAATDGNDNAPFKFNQVVIVPGTGNDIDWGAAIAGAELTTPSGGTVAGVVNTGSITFSGFNRSVSTDFGFIDDNVSKTYTLRIWLKDNLGVLGQTIDEEDFVFTVSAANISLDDLTNSRLSSKFNGTPSFDSNKIPVEVTATAWAFTTQPAPTTVLVQTNFSTPPTATAVDEHGNVDQGADGSVAISNTGGLGMRNAAIPVAITTLTATDGIVNFPAQFQYTGAGNGTLTVTGPGASPVNSNAGAGNIPCTAITVNYSNLSTITAGSGVARILSTNTAAPGVPAFTFTYNDDGGVGLGDGANTQISVIKVTPETGNEVNWGTVIAGATLSDGSSTVNAFSIDNTGITFSGPLFTASTLATVADATSAKTYTLNIWFNTTLGGLRTSIDQDRLVFEMSTAAANLTLAATSSGVAGTTTVDSDPSNAGTNGLFEVDATQLIFTQDFTAGALAIPPVPPVAHAAIDYLVNTSASAQSFNNPVIEAVDIYGNRDTNFTGAVTTTAAGGMALSNPLTSVTSGIGTFPSTFAYQTTGDGTLNVATAVNNRVGAPPAATPALSGTAPFAHKQPVNVKTGTATRVDSPAVAGGSISSITNASPGTTVFTFSITDDPAGTPVLQNDGNPTKITDITVTSSSLNNDITFWTQAIAGARLEDASDNTKFATLSAIGDGILIFNGINVTGSGQLGWIDDNQTKTYNLRIWLKTDLSGLANYPDIIDGMRFGFDVNSDNISTDPTGTSFLSNTNANSTNVATPVTVFATAIDITSPVGPTNVSLDVPYTPYIQARDINNNRDLGYNETITEFVNASSPAATMANGPTVGVTTFNAGVIDFAFSFPNFRFTAGNNGDDVTITLKAGTGTNCGVNAICTDLTPTLTLITSSESAIVGDPTFSFVTNIPYINYPETGSLTFANSFELARLLLVDGSRNGFNYVKPVVYTGSPSGSLTTNTFSTPDDGLPNADQDGAPTRLNSIEFTITNPANISRIELYSNGVAIPGTEQAVNIPQGTASQTFSFSGSPLLLAADDQITDIDVRVTFWNNATQVVDNQLIQISVTDAVFGDGSKFFEDTDPSYIGGVLNGLSAPTNVNLIEVIASQLDFTTQPAAFEGINQPINTMPVIEARDANAVVDLDHDYTTYGIYGYLYAFNGPVNAGLLNQTFPFIQGVLDLNNVANIGYPAHRYTSQGDGTLYVESYSPDFGNWIFQTSTHVDVINVTAELANDGVAGITAGSPSNTVNNNVILTAGAVNQVIYGAAFKAPYSITGEPKLQSFRVSFKGITAPNTIDKIIIAGSVRVFSRVNSYTYSSGAVTSVPATVSISTDSTLLVTLTTPQQLSSTPISYWIMVDIDKKVNSSFAALRPQLIDQGYDFGSNAPFDNNTRIGLTNANLSATTLRTSDLAGVGAAYGNTYSFAAVVPPKLVSSVPAIGDLNADKNGPILLTFDVPVLSANDTIRIYRKSKNSKIDDVFVAVGVLDITPENIAALPGPTYPIVHFADNGSSIQGQGYPTLEFDLFDPFVNGLPVVLHDDSVYYILIDQGFLGNKSSGGTIPSEGILDASANLFPGISSSLDLYFKTASTIAPELQVTNTSVVTSSPQGLMLSTQFDQKGGTAYFVVLPNAAAAPISNAEILAYPGSPTLSGSFPINAQGGTEYNFFPANLTAGNSYKIFMYAENGNPNGAVPSGAYALPATPQGNFTQQTVAPFQPTLTFTAGAVADSIMVNPLSTNICLNSTVTLAPITLIESLMDDFTKTTASQIQTLNFVLPDGYQFNTSVSPTLTLTGEFDQTIYNASQPKTKFISSTVIRLYFKNITSASLDVITLSDLEVIASGTAIASNREITRLGGTAFPNDPKFTDGVVVAELNLNSPDEVSFTNEYTLNGLLQSGSNTVIPDNASLVKLIPVLPANDYGPTTFSGTGIVNDQLDPEGVTLDASFEVTMTHTNNLGCVATKVENYTVYDSKRAISSLTPPIFLSNWQYSIYPDSSTSITVGKSTRTAYWLDSLSASAQGVDNSRWSIAVLDTLFKYSFLSKDPTDAGFHPATYTSDPDYKSYDWVFDWASIDNINGGSFLYDPLTDTVNNYLGAPVTYVRGGSIGTIIFTGRYRSDANPTNYVNILQPVELFVPARPVILPVTVPTSTLLPPSPGLADVVLYCESGGDVNIAAFPDPQAGTSTGVFELVELDSTTVITGGTNVFIDNQNGTMVLKPGGIVNSSSISSDYATFLIRYTYTITAAPAGSQSVVYIPVKIVPNPVASFTNSTYTCAGSDITFTPVSTIAAPYTSADIAQSIWNFGDAVTSRLGNPNDTTILVANTNVIHNYGAAAQYTVSHSLVSNFGCPSPTVSQNIPIGAVPVPQFSIIGSSTTGIAIVDESTIANVPTASASIGSVNINFGSGTPTSIAAGATALKTDYAPGHYNVTLIAISSLGTPGCQDTLMRHIVVLPTASAGAYSNDFNSDDGQWQTLPDSLGENALFARFRTRNSWAYGNASAKFNALTTGVWSTGLLASEEYDTLERSFLYSPKLNFASLARPMISFDAMYALNPGDGVVLEYSSDNLNVADPNKVWTALGSDVSGVDWFNQQSIAAKPGKQTIGDYGWTGTTINLVEPKHTLSDFGTTTLVQGIPEIEWKNRPIIFRFAFANNNIDRNKGFALDNFRIGERTRTVLIENFTNLGNTLKDRINGINDVDAEKYETNALQALPVGNDIVVLNYHTSFPKQDPFNLDNPSDPGARALYYNVTTTPSAVLDGKNSSTINNKYLSEWGPAAYNQQALKLAAADIVITPNIVGSNEAYQVTIDVTAADTLPASTILHVVFAEKKVPFNSLSDTDKALVLTGEQTTPDTTTFQYVVRKMLPFASGTKLNTRMLPGETRQFNLPEWTPDANALNNGGLVVVAFLQGETSQNVHQSEMTGLLPALSTVTGIENPFTLKDIKIYPNPADDQLNIVFPNALEVDVPLMMFDPVGRVTHNHVVKKGEESVTLETGGNSAGVYILQMNLGEGRLVRTKVIINHQE